MQTAADLKQALQSLQLQTKHNVEEMHAKDELRKRADAENFTLSNEIKTTEEEIRIAEQKIAQMKQSVLAKKRKKDENTKIINKAAQEITHMRMEAQRSQSQLTEIEREYREAVAEQSRMGGGHGMKLK